MLHLLTLNPLLSFTTSGTQTGSKLQTEFSFPGFSVLPLGFFSLPAVLFAESMFKSIFYLFIFFGYTRWHEEILVPGSEIEPVSRARVES